AWPLGAGPKPRAASSRSIAPRMIGAMGLADATPGIHWYLAPSARFRVPGAYADSILIDVQPGHAASRHNPNNACREVTGAAAVRGMTAPSSIRPDSDGPIDSTLDGLWFVAFPATSSRKPI